MSEVAVGSLVGGEVEFLKAPVDLAAAGSVNVSASRSGSRWPLARGCARHARERAEYHDRQSGHGEQNLAHAETSPRGFPWPRKCLQQERPGVTRNIRLPLRGSVSR